MAGRVQSLLNVKVSDKVLKEALRDFDMACLQEDIQGLGFTFPLHSGSVEDDRPRCRQSSSESSDRSSDA